MRAHTLDRTSPLSGNMLFYRVECLFNWTCLSPPPQPAPPHAQPIVFASDPVPHFPRCYCLLSALDANGVSMARTFLFRQSQPKHHMFVIYAFYPDWNNVDSQKKRKRPFFVSRNQVKIRSPVLSVKFHHNNNGCFQQI